MKVYKDNIERQTLQNTFYRKIIFTTQQLQLVLMAIPTGEEIGEEIHPHTTQFIRIESGTGVAYISGRRFNLKDGDAFIIPPGTKHNVRSTGNIKLYSIYAPPEHSPHCNQRHK